MHNVFRFCVFGVKLFPVTNCVYFMHCLCRKSWTVSQFVNKIYTEFKQWLVIFHLLFSLEFFNNNKILSIFVSAFLKIDGLLLVWYVFCYYKVLFFHFSSKTWSLIDCLIHVSGLFSSSCITVTVTVFLQCMCMRVSLRLLIVIQRNIKDSECSWKRHSRIYAVI